jgi:hypothetical protein
MRARTLVAYLAVALLVAVYSAGLTMAARHRAGSVTPLEDGRILLRIWGYRDEIVFAARSAGGAYTELELMSSRETPMYAPETAVRRYLERLASVPIPRIPSVDGISGATVTSDAIRNALVAAAPRPRGDLALLVASCAIWVIAVAVTLVPLSSRARRAGRVGVSAAAFVCLGIVWNVPVTLASLASPRALLVLTPLIALACAALYRNLWCRHLCPVGSASRLLEHVTGPIARPLVRSGAPGALVAAIRPGRYVLLAVGATSLALGNELYLEPYAYLFSRRPVWWLYLLPLAALALSLIARRLWCAGFCPLGAALDLAGRLRQWIAGDSPVRPRRPELAAPEAGALPVVIAGAIFGLILFSNLLLYFGAAR